MKLFENFNYFEFLNSTSRQRSKTSQQSIADDSNVDEYGIGAAMPADVVGFAFAKDNRAGIHLE